MAFELHSQEGASTKQPLRTVTDLSHAARRNGTKATCVKNKGAFPPADARTYCPEEGSDDDSWMPPRDRRGGGLPRLKDIGLREFRTAGAKRKTKHAG
jgi:hypothetical protein